MMPNIKEQKRIAIATTQKAINNFFEKINLQIADLQDLLFRITSLIIKNTSCLVKNTNRK